MQFLVISHQLWEIALSVLIGVYLGAAYDGIRFIRRMLSPLALDLFFANLFDVLYGIFCGGVYCIFVYYASSGRFRWFTALGMLIGFVIYRLLPGKVIKPFLYFVSDKILLILSLVLLPVKKAVTIIKKAAVRSVEATKRKAAVRKTEKYKMSLYSDIAIGNLNQKGSS